MKQIQGLLESRWAAAQHGGESELTVEGKKGSRSSNLKRRLKN
jgi:hypothetical protein